MVKHVTWSNIPPSPSTEPQPLETQKKKKKKRFTEAKRQAHVRLDYLAVIDRFHVMWSWQEEPGYHDSWDSVWITRVLTCHKFKTISFPRNNIPRYRLMFYVPPVPGSYLNQGLIPRCRVLVQTPKAIIPSYDRWWKWIEISIISKWIYRIAQFFGQQ